MGEASPVWRVSLILLGLLLAGALIEAVLGLGHQPIRLWVFYLAAHSFCYALVVGSADELAPSQRLRAAAGFSGAVMLGTMIVSVVLGHTAAGSRALELLTIAPLAFLVAVLFLAIASIALGLGYGVCIAVGQRIWFPHRAPAFFPVVILHGAWGMAASLIAVGAISWMAWRSSGSFAGAIGGYLMLAGLMWLLSIPHLILARRTSSIDRRSDVDDPMEPPRAVRGVGLAAALVLPAAFIWSFSPAQTLLSLSGASVETIRIGDQTYSIPTRLIAARHLDNLGKLDRRWFRLRMTVGGSDDPAVSGLEEMTFNVQVEEVPVSDRVGSTESLNCARNLFGEMSGCWVMDAMDWENTYPFAKPPPDSVFEFIPPHVISRIDIAVIDSRRRYQALLSGLTGAVYLDDGRAGWRFRVPDESLSQLDKIIVAARAFQERLKRENQTSASMD